MCLPAPIKAARRGKAAGKKKKQLIEDGESGSINQKFSLQVKETVGGLGR